MRTTAVCLHNYKNENAGSDDTIILPNFDVEMYLHKYVKGQKKSFFIWIDPIQCFTQFWAQTLDSFRKMYHNHMMRAWENKKILWNIIAELVLKIKLREF